MDIRSAKSAARFFCAMDLLIGVLPWLVFVYGISDNLSYNKYTDSVTAVSDAAPAGIVEGEYEYFTENGDSRQVGFTAFDVSKDEYTEGSRYIVFTHEDRSGDITEYDAKTAMLGKIMFPLNIIIPALLTVLFGAKRAEEYSEVRKNFPKSFCFSIAAPLISCAAMSCTLIIWENYANLFAELAELEFGVKLETAVFGFALLIAEIIVWSVSIRREEKKSGC